MSQIYKEMNKVGKINFYVGSIMAIIGIAGSIIAENNLYPASLAVGLYYIATASFDKRCNHLNDSKGNPLPTKK